MLVPAAKPRIGGSPGFAGKVYKYKDRSDKDGSQSFTHLLEFNKGKEQAGKVFEEIKSTSAYLDKDSEAYQEYGK